LSYKIINSTTILLPAWKEFLKSRGRDVLIIPRDVRTRWNSTFDMLSFVLKYRTEVTDFTAVAANGLRKFELDDDEWETLDSICEILEQGTLLFSKEAALLSQVIPAMDIIEDVFTTMTIEKPDPNDAKRTITKTLSPALKASMALGHATLNKYYRLTDDSEVYRIAM
ncbi:hypothetical protein BDZ89DRAFT_892493, partial [Hymenopellis radicata]